MRSTTAAAVTAAITGTIRVFNNVRKIRLLINKKTHSYTFNKEQLWSLIWGRQSYGDAEARAKNKVGVVPCCCRHTGCEMLFRSVLLLLEFLCACFCGHRWTGATKNPSRPKWLFWCRWQMTPAHATFVQPHRYPISVGENDATKRSHHDWICTSHISRSERHVKRASTRARNEG